MSPASRARHGKGGEKGSEKAPAKEWKASRASSKHSSLGAGMPASAYNPGTGMFHMLDSSISENLVSDHSGRFRSIDESEEIGSLVGSYSEYDSVSNNGSCSGESEDQLQSINGKDKKGQPPGVVGGSSTSSDKRDKIRYKNEKKHQRQKERRAQELRDRCTGYLMSRKLEALAQQLVAMGFSPDKATMALILNEGHVERSVAWLLEGGEGQVKEDWNAEGALKIDISEELARIAELEIRFKYLRVEIERAIVACEGDLDKAAEWLRDRHPQTPLVPPEYGGAQTQDRGKEEQRQASSPVAAPSYLMTAKGRGSSGLFQAFNQQQRREDKDPQQQMVQQQQQNRPQAGGYQSILSRSSGVAVDGTVATGRARPPSSSEGKGTISNTGAPLSSYPPPVRQHAMDPRAPPRDTSAAPSRREPAMPARDPAVAPQSPITPPSNITSASASPSLSPSSWHHGAPGASSPLSVLFFNGTAGDRLFKGVVEGGKPTGETHSKQAEETAKVQPLQLSHADLQGSVWGGVPSYGARDNALPSTGMADGSSTSHIRSQPTPKFLSGWGSGLPGGPADWSMWISSGCDYRSIDWSMGASPSNSSSEASVWRTASSFASVLTLAESGKPGIGLVGDRSSSSSQVGYTGNRDTAAGSSSGGSNSSINYHLWNGNRGSSGSGLGLQDKSGSDAGNPAAGIGVVPEWTSPFAGKDLFTLPHQAVPSPLL